MPFGVVQNIAGHQGRNFGNWMELDVLLKSLEERRQLEQFIWQAMENGAPPFVDQNEGNYRQDDIQVLMWELQQRISDDTLSGEIAEFSIRGQEPYSGKEIPIAVQAGRDIVLENEFGAFFARELDQENLTMVRIVTDVEATKERFVDKAERKYAENMEERQRQQLMERMDRLFQSDLATYQRLAGETDHLVDIEVHIAGAKDDWHIVFRKDAPPEVAGQGKDAKSTLPSSPSSTDYGGIDFNASNLNIKEHGQAAKMNLPHSTAIRPESVQGFSPIIIHITPVVNFPLLLGDAGGRVKHQGFAAH